MSSLERLAGLGERLVGAVDETGLAELCTQATPELLGARSVVWLSERLERGAPASWDETSRLVLRRAALATLPGAGPVAQLPAEAVPPALVAELGGHEVWVAALRVRREPVGVLVAVLPAGAPEPRAALGMLAQLASSALFALRSGELLRDEARRLEAQVDQRTRDLRRAEAQLMASDRLATLGTLVAGIGHEITNPLATVMLNNGALSARLARAQLPAGVLTEAQRLIAENDEALERIRAVVSELRTFARKDDESVIALDLRPIVESSLRLCRAQLKGVELHVELPGLPAVRGSATRLGQVFLNLIVNAAQAVAQVRAPRIEVRGVVSPAGDEVRVAVCDNGPGVPDEVRARIFDMFFTTKAPGEGTGLGLAIVRDIVARHGGRVELEAAAPGETGARFWVILPALARDVPAKLRTPSSPAVKPARRKPSVPSIPAMDAPGGPRPKILVVDDEVMILRALARELAEDFDVVVARNGAEAIAAVAKGPFDALLCDVNLSGGESGEDVLARLEAQGAGLADRTVFMSGVPSDVADKGKPGGKRRFVAKPFQLQKLVEALRSVLPPPPPPGPKSTPPMPVPT